MTNTLYGISNCDTMKKARKWLDDHDIDYVFHDYRKDGLEPARLEGWCRELGVDALLNRRGTTWRKLPESVKENLTDAAAIKLMLENPAMIKRPMLDTGRKRTVGFSADQYAVLFTNA